MHGRYEEAVRLPSPGLSSRLGNVRTPQGEEKPHSRPTTRVSSDGAVGTRSSGPCGCHREWDLRVRIWHV